MAIIEVAQPAALFVTAEQIMLFSSSVALSAIGLGFVGALAFWLIRDIAGALARYLESKPLTPVQLLRIATSMRKRAAVLEVKAAKAEPISKVA